MMVRKKMLCQSIFFRCLIFKGSVIFIGLRDRKMMRNLSRGVRLAVLLSSTILKFKVNRLSVWSCKACKPKSGRFYPM